MSSQMIESTQSLIKRIEPLINVIDSEEQLCDALQLVVNEHEHSVCFSEASRKLLLLLERGVISALQLEELSKITTVDESGVIAFTPCIQRN